VDAPPGWRIEPNSSPFKIEAVDEETAVSFTVTPPEEAGAGELRAVATLGGRDYSRGMRVIAPEGIPPQTIFPPAAARLVRTNVATLAKRVGYVMGAGDEVPEALRQIGCEVALLSADDLSGADLNRFDAIVTGIRAYNVRRDLLAHQQRLMEYVKGGGTLIVQYITPGRFGSAADGFGPFKFQVSGARVTVEEAPVAFLNPSHPLLNLPNRIGQGDFEGWVQERGLNFASQWDPQYEPLFELNDPGEAPQRGATLFVRHGKGAYVFTALAWFRQLPAGVPGAYRIFANLMSAAKVEP
jgi:hypothetical protein